MSDVLVPEDEPAIIVGPICKSSDDFIQWMLTMHVQMCAKGGVDCRSCAEAVKRGIGRAS